MIERVARAINPFEWEAFDENRFPLENRGKECLHSWNQARAAIEAMMEPTEAMVEAGDDAHASATGYQYSGVREAYAAMLLAALHGDQEG